MIFRTSTPAPRRGVGSARLDALVAAHLPDADDETRQIVAAVAGLLACVAYADREYSTAEQQHVREALSQIDGLGAGGVEAICVALRDHIVEVAASNTQAYTRTLRELAEPGVRREVLDVLVDLAAADDELALSETHLLRRATDAMGLSQDDYLAAQARHRERLSLLK